AASPSRWPTCAISACSASRGASEHRRRRQGADGRSEPRGEQSDVGLTGRMPSGWPPASDGSPFGLHSLPYGVFAGPGEEPARAGVAIGDHVLDLPAALAAADPSGGAHLIGAFRQPSLNAFLASGPPVWAEMRE